MAPGLAEARAPAGQQRPKGYRWFAWLLLWSLSFIVGTLRSKVAPSPGGAGLARPVSPGRSRARGTCPVL